MLAYKTEDLDNAAILQHAKKWFKHKLLSEQSFEAIKLKHPDLLYSPNFFIRIGLFIFTVISLLAANSFLLLITGGFDSSSEYAYAIRLIFHGAVMMVALETLIKNKKLYRCGIDDALLYSGICCIISGVCLLFYNYERNETDSLLIYAFIALPILIATTHRYADILAAVASFVCFFAIVFILLSKTGEIAKMIMPFVIMIFSAILYFQVAKYRTQYQFRFWDSPMLILEILSLLLFYMAGNYFIVRTLSEVLFEMELQEGQDIPLAFFFYAFTALIPLAYVFFGLKKKNRVLLQAGLVLIGAAVITFKYYYSLGHHEITLTISGIIMIGVAWLSIRYLKTPQHGITFTEDTDEKILEKFDAEALIIAQTFSGPQHTGNQGPEMGGGKFGGGGADGGY